MSSLAVKHQLARSTNELKNELLRLIPNNNFEVHQQAPEFWNEIWESRIKEYLSLLPQAHFSTCPHCSQKINAPQTPNEFNDPWWIFPQKVFDNIETCSHFEMLTFSILWTQSEPISAPWIIPCGWGVPALTEDLKQNENLSIFIKSQPLSNGAIIFWIGFYREHPGIPLFGDYWQLPVLKSRVSVKPSFQSKGFWGEFSPLTIHNSIIWSKLFFENSDGTLINYETKKDTTGWMQKIKTWNHFAYTQPLKMISNRFIAESGLASFSIGMRSSKEKGALFISQTPIFQYQIPTQSPLIDPPDNANSSSSSIISSAPLIQNLTVHQMKDLAYTDTLWALVDPFQNEGIQDWIRKITHLEGTSILPLWKESDLTENWLLSADYSLKESYNIQNLLSIYRDLSPLIIKITPESLELSYHYSFGSQSWGAFFISSNPAEVIHSFLRQRLVSHVHDQLVYFRYYETNFLSVALSTLKGANLNYFYGPITAWILRNSTESYHTLYSPSKQTIQEINTSFPYHLPKKIHEAAQRAFQFDQPRRMILFIEQNAPELLEILPNSVLNRWIHLSMIQARHFGIHKEPLIIKFFLWKVFITPAWIQASTFTKILKQNVAEEIKVQTIENLLPQLKLNEIPRGITIESWDPILWNELRKCQSPLANADPGAFHNILGEKPPVMPLQNKHWFKALGLFYESAYLELYDLSGISLLRTPQSHILKKPTHAPPRLLTLSRNEIAVRDEGMRSQTWLQDNGFYRKSNSKSDWIYRSHLNNSILFILRLFLQEFPYIDSQDVFKILTLEERAKVLNQISIYSVEWDSHQFWQLKPFSLDL